MSTKPAAGNMSGQAKSAGTNIQQTRDEVDAADLVDGRNVETAVEERGGQRPESNREARRNKEDEESPREEEAPSGGAPQPSNIATIVA